MFSGIPLPNMQEITIPKQLNALNELQKQRFENQILNVKAQYAPLTTLAEAGSKLAYQSLIGPQFVAKLMGNPDILANIPDDKKAEALNMLYRAGSSNPLINNLEKIPDQQQSLSDFLVNKIKNVFSQPSPEAKNSVAENNMKFDLPERDKNAINNLSPGQSYVIPENNKKNSFSENVGRYKGIISEGEKSGDIRANDIKDLNDTFFSAKTNQSTLDNLSNILSSPEFEKIRQVPLAGHHELSYYSKFGTPEQQNMVGQYYTLTGNIIKDSARDFAGAFRTGEQKLLSGMKPSPSDTVDVARGKTEALSIMNKMLSERSRITSDIMSKNHINKLQAQEIADKQIDGKSIRDEIHNKLNPKPTDDDIKFMSEKYKISPDEVRKRLKQKGIM